VKRPVDREGRQIAGAQPSVALSLVAVPPHKSRLMPSGLRQPSFLEQFFGC
jgi:hypothetical protein